MQFFRNNGYALLLFKMTWPRISTSIIEKQKCLCLIYECVFLFRRKLIKIILTVLYLTHSPRKHNWMVFVGVDSPERLWAVSSFVRLEDHVGSFSVEYSSWNQYVTFFFPASWNYYRMPIIICISSLLLGMILLSFYSHGLKQFKGRYCRRIACLKLRPGCHLRCSAQLCIRCKITNI